MHESNESILFVVVVVVRLNKRRKLAKWSAIISLIRSGQLGKRRLASNPSARVSSVAFSLGGQDSDTRRNKKHYKSTQHRASVVFIKLAILFLKPAAPLLLVWCLPVAANFIFSANIYRAIERQRMSPEKCREMD